MELESTETTSTSANAQTNVKDDRPQLASLTASPGTILIQCNHLIKDAKNFNLHANVLKQLLNLKDRSGGYEIYARRPSVPEKADSSDINNNDNSGAISDIGKSEDEGHQESSQTALSSNTSPSFNKLSSSASSLKGSIDLEVLKETIKKLQEEVAESHRLGFCLAYNIQCLHKRLTGSPIDLHSGANMIRQLQEKYDSFKTREAILKYEFQEKRKLLRRLRNQLEETREDWRLLRVSKRRKNSDEQEDDVLWSEALRKQFASKKKQPSEESGFVEASREGIEVSSSTPDNCAGESKGELTGTEKKATITTGYEDLAIALDNRRAKLDHLEDECYNLFATLSARSGNRSTETTEINGDHQYHAAVRSTDLPIATPLLFPDDLADELLAVDDDDDENDVDVDDVDDNEDDELSDPLSDEFDELNLPVDNYDPLEPIDNTEAEMSDLPWDSNNLYESRAASLLTDSNQIVTTNLQTNSADNTLAISSDLPSTLTLPLGNMVHIGVGMDEDDEDNEYTQQEMTSLAETGEPLVLCRLRRRAVEILVSRLRDEKILHESRESELKEQLDELKRINADLTKEFDKHRSTTSFWTNSERYNVRILITSMMTTLLFTASAFVYFLK